MSLPSFLHRKAAPAPPARITIRRRLLGRGSRLRSAGVAAGLLGLGLASAQPARAATYSWNGVPGDWFSNPSNWTLNNLPASYPGAGDDAQNLTTAAMTLGQGTTVNSFLSDGAFTLNGGTFTGNKANAASTLQVNNIFTLNGGQVNNFTLKAGVQQSGQPAPSVVVANNGSNSLSNTIVNANVDMTQAGNGAYLAMLGTDTVNAALNLATVSSDSYGLRLSNNATLVIGSTGALQGYGHVSEDTSPSTLINNGLVNATGGALIFNQSFFNNAAGATAEATGGGTLSLSHTNTNSGMIKATGAGSVVSITGSLTGTGTAASGNLLTASGGGQIQINGASLLGTINTDAATALVIGNNGSNLFNNTTLNGNLDMTQAGNGAYLALLGTDTVNGTISLATVNSDSYGLRLSNNATLVLNSGSSLVGYGHVSEDTSPSTLTNNGLVNATGGALIFNQSFFNNAAGATAEATGGGTLSLNNTTNNSGMIKAVGNNGSGTGSVVGITGRFTGTGTAASGNLLTASGGGQIQINGASLLGTINTDAATALVIGNNGSNLFNNTTLNGNLDMTQAGNGAYLALLGTDTVNGTISLATVNSDGYGLRLSNNATLVLGGTSTLQGYGHVSEDTSPSTLINNGLVNANSAGNTLIFNQTTFNNKGTAEATNGGTLSLNNKTNNAAGATVAAVGAGSVVGITGTFTGTGNNLLTASGGGQIQVNGASLLGTINTDAATALFFNPSGNNVLNGTTVNGNLNVTNGASQNAFLQMLGTDTVNGAITLGTVDSDGYGLRLSNNATLVLNSGSSLTGFGHVSEDTSPSTFTSNGLVNANNSTTALTMTESTFNNAGTAEATNGGTLSLNRTTNNSGMVKAVGAGSLVGITGVFTGTGSSATNLLTASGGGQIQVNGASLLGTINTDAATALFFNPSGNNVLNGTTVNGNLNVTNGASQNAFLQMLGTDTVNGAITLGTVDSDGYGLRLSNNATLVLNSGSSLTGFGHVSEDTSPSTFTSNGLVNANNSTTALTMTESTFNNAGTAEATNGGTLSLNRTTNNAAGATVAALGAGSVVGITGTFTGTGNNLLTASGGGQIQVNGASLLGTINTDAATALVFNGSGNNVLNGTTVNGNLNVTGGANQNAYLASLGTDKVNGTISLATVNSDGYGLRLSNNANLVLGSTGTLQGYGHVSEDTSPSTLTNNGLVNANSAGNTLVLNQSTFNNTGTAQATNGATLNVTSGNVTNSGTVAVQVGGTVNFTQGLTQTAGLTQVFGVLNASETLNGGVLGGSKTINGNIINNGGIVQPVVGGPGFASLNINGNFSQGSGGELDAFFGNNFHNLLNVSGQTTTGGTLGVFDLDQTQFTGTGSTGTQFAFLDYSGTLTPDGSTVNGFTQYFTNEMPDSNISGTIKGQNGFVFELTNIANPNGGGMLDLTVTKVGAPVPEASTTVSLGLLLALGLGGMVVAAKRKKKA